MCDMMWWWRWCFWCGLKYGNTPAHYAACSDGTGEKLKLIVAACPACIDVQNNDGYTPLHNAAYQGYEKCIQVLISAGCNSLLKNKDGNTAYDEATASAELIKQKYDKTHYPYFFSMRESHCLHRGRTTPVVNACCWPSAMSPAYPVAYTHIHTHIRADMDFFFGGGSFTQHGQKAECRKSDYQKREEFKSNAA